MNIRIVRALVFALLAASPAALAAPRPSIADLQAQIASQQAQIAALQANNIPGLASYVSVDTSTPGRPAVRVTAANLQVVNGLGLTASVNGVGNLIVGYGEPATPSMAMQPVCSVVGWNSEAGCTAHGGTWDVDQRTGSHNLVIGTFHRYTGAAGLLAGTQNTLTAYFVSIPAGKGNTASYQGASVSGGKFNTASGESSSVSGGQNNNATGDASSVSGGILNSAGSANSSVSGGAQRSAMNGMDWAAGSLYEPY